MLAAEVPTAYLNLDLVFLRTNRSFQQIMSGGQEVSGRNLHELATPADNESFQAIRNRLRAERDGREPAYMPPILHANQDPLRGVHDADIDRLTFGVADHTYTWTRSRSGTDAERFPARVRLAKAATYFVVVTLPSFRPVASQISTPMSPAGFAVPQPAPFTEIQSTRRLTEQQSVPPSGYYGLPSTGGPSSFQPFPSPRTYPPAQPMQNPAHPIYSPAQQISPSPTRATAFTPLSTAREAMQPPGPRMQLPPLGGTPAGGTGAGPSASPLSEVPTQRASSSDVEGEDGRDLESPRKRRRMDIEDVLHR